MTTILAAQLVEIHVWPIYATKLLPLAMVVRIKMLFYKSNRPHFLWVYHFGYWENTRKARKSFAAFLAFSQHPAWVITTVNP